MYLIQPIFHECTTIALSLTKSKVCVSNKYSSPMVKLIFSSIRFFFSGKYNEDGQEHIAMRENERLKRKIEDEQDSFLSESAMDVSQQMRESEKEEADERQHRCCQIN